MSAIEKRLKAAAFTALDVIAGLADKYGGDNGEHAATALKTIRAIIESVSQGFERKIDPQAVMKAIEASVHELEHSLAANDAAARQALHDKFKDAGSPIVETSTSIADTDAQTGVTDNDDTLGSTTE